ncbi:hypothetical protein BDZ89DRAFT_1067885 [Hymenopellis radicata]|nr:hypothetical protein BDZ89DRAFT_1067885 [Hymenopellis radicata]
MLRPQCIELYRRPLRGLVACLYAANPEYVRCKYNLGMLREIENLVVAKLPPLFNWHVVHLDHSGDCAFMIRRVLTL